MEPSAARSRASSSGRTLLLSIRGQSVEEQPAGRRRAILARVELTTEAAAYRWLNTCFVVGEGEIDEETEQWWVQAFVCVNEVVEHPPALGASPPPRFRQAEANAPDADP